MKNSDTELQNPFLGTFPQFYAVQAAVAVEGHRSSKDHP